MNEVCFGDLKVVNGKTKRNKVFTLSPGSSNPDDAMSIRGQEPRQEN